MILDPFDPRVAAHVAEAVATAAMETGVAQNLINPEKVKERLLALAEEKEPALVGGRLRDL